MSINANFQRLRELTRTSMARLQVPGAAIGVTDGEDVLSDGFGVTSVDHPLAVDATTLFQIGSITKTVTATAAMRLVESGQLELDAPIRTYLPDLYLSSADLTEQVTLKHLFTHTSGWEGDDFGTFDPADDALAKYVARMADLPQWTPLGEVWSYNNAGFNLAGRVVEANADKTFEAAVKELVFNPLGMTHSYFFAADVMTHRFVVGHVMDNDRPIVARPWPITRPSHPAGGAVSCVRDMMRYARFMLRGGVSESGARVLKSETLALMQTPLVQAGSFADTMGVSWWINDVSGTRVVMHEGSTHGQNAVLFMVPEHHWAIVVLTNSDTGGQLCHEVTDWALGHFLGIARPEPVFLAHTREELAVYAGQYEATLFTLEVRLHDSDLMLQTRYKGGFPTKETPPPPSSVSPPMRLAFIETDRVIALDPPYKDSRGEFLRDSAGNIAWFRFLGRLHRPA